MSEVIGEEFLMERDRRKIKYHIFQRCQARTAGGSVVANDEEKVVENRGPMKDVLQVLEERLDERRDEPERERKRMKKVAPLVLRKLAVRISVLHAYFLSSCFFYCE